MRGLSNLSFIYLTLPISLSRPNLVGFFPPLNGLISRSTQSQGAYPRLNSTRVVLLLGADEPSNISQSTIEHLMEGPNMARGGVNSLFKKSTNSLEQVVSK